MKVISLSNHVVNGVFAVARPHYHNPEPYWFSTEVSELSKYPPKSTIIDANYDQTFNIFIHFRRRHPHLSVHLLLITANT